MHDTTYEAQRRAFQALCAEFAPLHRKDEVTATADDDFDRLVGSRIFPQIAVHERTLLARSRPVWIPSGDRVHSLGEYLIEIGGNYFAAHNLTRTVGNCHHPHINPSGTFCMSDGQQEIMQMMRDGRLAAALIAIESAFWQVGPGMQYQQARLYLWPELERKDIECSM